MTVARRKILSTEYILPGGPTGENFDCQEPGRGTKRNKSPKYDRSPKKDISSWFVWYNFQNAPPLFFSFLICFLNTNKYSLKKQIRKFKNEHENGGKKKKKEKYSKEEEKKKTIDI